MIIPKKNQFGSCWVYTLDIIHPGNLLKIYIYIYIYPFPTLHCFSIQSITRVDCVQRVHRLTPKLIFHYLLFPYFFAYTPLLLKGLKIHLLILLLIFCFLLKNIRNNNIIIEEYIKIINKIKGKRKKVKGFETKK